MPGVLGDKGGMGAEPPVQTRIAPEALVPVLVPVTYKEARARLKGLPRAEQDALLRRMIAHRREVDRAAGPWQAIGMLISFAALGALILVNSRDLGSLPIYAALFAAFILSGWLQHLASRRKRAYEQAHPFQV